MAARLAQGPGTRDHRVNDGRRQFARATDVTRVLPWHLSDDLSYYSISCRRKVAVEPPKSAAMYRNAGFAPRVAVLRVVGPLGLEPRTKGFTSAPPFPEGVDYLFTPEGCGKL